MYKYFAFGGAHQSNKGGCWKNANTLMSQMEIL